MAGTMFPCDYLLSVGSNNVAVAPAAERCPVCLSMARDGQGVSRFRGDRL